MSEAHIDVESVVPAWRAASAFAQEHDDHGVSLDTLPAGTMLIVGTRNSQYRITVLDGKERHVLVQGGTHLPSAIRAHLEGSYDGGSIARDGWIEPHRRMLLVSDTNRIVTSPVSSVSIEPSDESHETEH